MQEKEIVRVKPIDNGGTCYVHIPKKIQEHLGFEDGDELFIMKDAGRHGKFVAIWKADKPKPPM